MFHVSRTLKNGASADLRAVVHNQDSANGTPISTLVNRTEPMVPRGVWQNIDAIVNGSSNFDIAFWWWYESAQLWILDQSIGTKGYTSFDATKGPIRIPILNNDTSACADGLYVEIANVIGHPLANVWLQGQQ